MEIKMQKFPKTNGHGTALNRDVVARTRRFLNEYGSALQTCAAALGGDRWQRRALALCEAVKGGSLSSKSCLKELNALLALLSLERVGQLEPDECGYFGLVEPDDPRVHDLCLMSDRLEDFVQSLEASDEIVQASMAA
ncbi:hypothetical protein KUV65_04065 [Maritalea mobilis]|uniref:hypothetical protein n=1 Tax=Maritalea mobilis TaxID=483324 RepID=UPI001C94776F|nr:hypothetical protein [Maritalea mobilis]MBY6200525.1 hypothetical protein [Maritalea mobilis]